MTDKEKEALYSEVRSKVYAALSDVVFDNFQTRLIDNNESKEIMEKSIEWWLTHFYEER